ncbi:E3 ubiquitin-protein ligase listerin isoform X1 [Lycium barbarum]|uniref:E3 ubiquitin-protein ligase listerin isoform X1 n=2 Tax=Lycium barbarum TaxID=112863 RepID=UPI00293E3043|nr:E3 ubiquitin-protein ligase listerin isoform X1 [Lycium barbarum]XP_060206971.1 E3 ubiquitin-protein ligase listerin isoform X1 [Lycium barbarum]XP_060206972.1 E3 ubiquitin-protein ligase listerin isoform X1 [Lycium barbarum]
MGRPKGDGARTKSRPSSSSLAASLLPQGSTPLGFGGYMGASRVDSTEDSPPFLDIDSEVAQHLKRLARKDPTTKLKALASLSQLFQQKTAKEIIPIIPQWAFEYKKLLLDYNREVRRATHDTMTNLVGVVGRDVAPYLKSLMGPWWFSQFDSVYEVSQAAKRSFQAAFPAQDKRLDVLILYTSEIFRYIEEILKLTPQSMSDKNVASDELEEMHKQVVSSSLLALATLLDVVVSVQSERPVSEAELKRASKAKVLAMSCAENLLSTHKLFLGFLKSQSSAIRSAAYSVMRSLLKNIPHAIKETDIIHLADAILGAFQEMDPSCHSSMWAVILLFSKKFPQSWSILKIKKSALSRFWHFLRNGCFGSQQVSYPALLLFLDVVPAQAVEAQKFLLEVFQNLWAGRSLSYSSHLDRLALFKAMKECFLFSLKNTDRYSDAADSYRFQQTLTDQILLKLLWHEYLFSVSSKNHSMDFSSDSIQPSHQGSRQLNVKIPEGYVRDLGKCIVEILSDIFLLEPDLLLQFCSTFQQTCLGVFQQTDSSVENAEGVTEFLSVVNQQAVRKGETWPLVYLVGPTLSKSLPIIKTLDSPNAVRFMVAAVSIFGPRKIIQEIFCIEPEAREFLHVFKETFVPRCLQANSPSTSMWLDLLISLLDDECLAEQWASIIMHATNSEELKYADGIVDSDCLSLLAMLIEKAKMRASNRSTLQVPYAAYWHHHLLDFAAISVVRAFPPFGTSNVSYMRAVLGGIARDDETNFLSQNTLVLVLGEVLKKLTIFMMDSPFIWVKDMCSMILIRDNNTELGFEPSMDVNEMVNFALQVLDGGFSALKCLHHEVELFSGIVAALFVINWECNMATVFNDELGEESREKIKIRLASCELVHALHRKICNQFLFTINIDSRKILESILVQTVRSAVLKDENLDAVKVTSLCCHWVLELLECLCQDQFEKQKLLDRFLSQDDSWPAWVAPDMEDRKGADLVKTESAPIDNPRVTRFVALIDRLIPKIGFDIIVAGAVSNVSPSSTEDPSNQPTTTPQCHYSRAWLAAEILCTWKWNGGNALCSFLPYFCEYLNSECYTPEDELLDSIVTILLDGALVYGGVAELSLSNLSAVTNMESIGEPFLRAVVSLLSRLFVDDVWGKEKAVFLFNLLLNKLHIGETININCLRILPSVMNVIIRPLSVPFDRESASMQSASTECCEVQEAIMDWLQRTQSFPPLNAWQTGEDMADWFYLVISCYPVRPIEGGKGLRPERYVSSTERMLLLELFQKQRKSSALSVINKLPVVQILLSKVILVAVAYCWEEFSEDDWEFVLYRFRWWIERAVVVMEEVAENVNDVITNASGCEHLEVMLKRVNDTVSVEDSTPIKLASNALIGFSLFCNISGFEAKNPAPDVSNRLKGDRWDMVKDRIIEGVLRLFFSTAATQASASSYGGEASSIVASSILDHSEFWDLVASLVVESSSIARDKAVKSVEIWGLSKGPVSSLYAMLFSAETLPSLRCAAYVILSTEPVSQLALYTVEKTSSSGGDADGSTEESLHLRAEVSPMLEKLPYEALQMDLLAFERIKVFLAWSLLLSHVVSLPSSSPLRERMVQYIQEFATSTVLDCLFQHIPLEFCVPSSLKKKDSELPASVSEAAKSATRAIACSSVSFCLESLWPVGPEKVASLAGAIFGLMLCILPAYVRGWFSNIRDRSTSSAIEFFTRAYCSPPLIMNELSQIKKANFADDNFSVTVSKSACEVVATYTKDETGMDLIICLPASYPLRPVDVDCTKSLGISEVKQRKWLMSMMSFLRNQNGALAEAICIWKSNFDKEFEGVEECPICYSVIHTSNHSLPRLACKTCKHKFHSACLYKWFSTSHKSTCPLCQSPF